MIPGSALEHHNLDSVSVRLHIALSFLRESLGRTCIWFEEDPSRAVPSRGLITWVVASPPAASVTSLRASQRINSSYLITCSFFKLLWCLFICSTNIDALVESQFWLSKQFLSGCVTLRYCVIQGLIIMRKPWTIDSPRDYLSILQSYMSSPKSVARSNRYQMTDLVVVNIYWTHTVCMFRSSPRNSSLLAASVLHLNLLSLLP